jgi:cytidylate kinase
MPRRVVCISRSAGAAGEEVGRLVAERLGYEFVDEEIVLRAAEKAGVEAEDVADVERRKSAMTRLFEDLGRTAPDAHGVAFEADRDRMRTAGELRAVIRAAIEETAERGDAVIVAHAASFALVGRDDALRVLVTASPPTRSRRLAEDGGVGEQQAAQSVRDSDTARADYLKRFYGIPTELPTHYDVVVNTDRLTPEEAADLIAGAASAK